jgi:hypothetical protein
MMKRQKLRRTMAVGLITAFMFSTVAIMPAAAAPKDNANSALQVPISGTTSTGGTFQGTATITGFAVDGQNVVAVGTITGIANGTQSIITTFSAPVTQPSATAQAAVADAAAAQAAVPQAAVACQILNLTLGPLNLNILGLVVNIPNPIVINITAVPGAGNLLGNLLCSVANLLNGSGQLQQIANLLNQILGILNGL